MDPNNPDVLYTGGIALWKYDGITATWTEVSNLTSNFDNGIHVDQHSMAWAGDKLIVGNDGGVWSTTDGGKTWDDHNTTLSLTQFYAGSIHPTNPNFALGGNQDNGTVKWTGTNPWEEINDGDGSDSAISSSKPDTHWTVSANYLAISRTRDGGENFESAIGGITDSGNEEVTPLIARFKKCSANDDVFVAGTDNLWRSDDFFSAEEPSWSPNGPEMEASITALAFAPSDDTCSTYALGTAKGQLRLTTDGGSSWVDIDPDNGVPGRYVTGLAFDPADANTLYVTLSGFDEGTPDQPGHLFKTINALAPSPTWSNVSPPVNLPHNAIALDPLDPNLVYVGTDLGVWESPDGGDTWNHLGPETGMPNVAVFDLQIHPHTGRLFAFTHGRGAFVLESAFVQVSGSLGFTETLTQSLKRFTVVNKSSFSIKGKISLTEIDIADFDEDTTFSISLGGFSFEATLGDDLRAKIGPKGGKASFPVLDEEDRIIGKVTLSWNAKQMSFSVSAKRSALAEEFVDADTGPIDESVEASVILGNALAAFTIDVVGNVTTKEITKGGEDFFLSNIKLKGTGEASAP